jgi:hypothetical protein
VLLTLTRMNLAGALRQRDRDSDRDRGRGMDRDRSRSRPLTPHAWAAQACLQSYFIAGDCDPKPRAGAVVRLESI